jgi:hypothetical protein
MAAQLITRGASAPAMTTVSGWADTLAHTVIRDLLISLGPASAGSELLQMGTVLDWGNSAKISVPGVVADKSNATFVGQGSPIPVRTLSVAAVSLTPSKLATIFYLTQEQLDSSNAEQLVRLVMIDSLAVALDTYLFDANAATSDRPAGLLNGVSAISPPTTGGGSTALLQDLGKLINAISPTSAGLPSSGLNICFVCDPGTAVKLKYLAGPKFDMPVLASNGVTANTIIAVALNALISVVDPMPRVQASRDAASHLHTVPAEIVTSSGTVATPIKTAFQTDTVGIKFVANVAWGLRLASLACMDSKHYLVKRMDEERMEFVEKAKANAAETRAELEEIFAERQALFDSGKLREVPPPPEIKQRSAAVVPLVYKTKLNAVPPEEPVSSGLTLVEIIAEEVALTQNQLSAHFNKQIKKLRAEMKILRELIEKPK